MYLRRRPCSRSAVAWRGQRFPPPVSAAPSASSHNAAMPTIHRVARVGAALAAGVLLGAAVPVSLSDAEVLPSQMTHGLLGCRDVPMATAAQRATFFLAPRRCKGIPLATVQHTKHALAPRRCKTVPLDTAAQYTKLFLCEAVPSVTSPNTRSSFSRRAAAKPHRRSRRPSTRSGSSRRAVAKSYRRHGGRIHERHPRAGVPLVTSAQHTKLLFAPRHCKGGPLLPSAEHTKVFRAPRRCRADRCCRLPSTRRLPRAAPLQRRTVARSVHEGVPRAALLQRRTVVVVGLTH